MVRIAGQKYAASNPGEQRGSSTKRPKYATLPEYNLYKPDLIGKFDNDWTPRGAGMLVGAAAAGMILAGGPVAWGGYALGVGAAALHARADSPEVVRQRFMYNNPWIKPEKSELSNYDFQGGASEAYEGVQQAAAIAGKAKGASSAIRRITPGQGNPMITNHSVVDLD